MDRRIILAVLAAFAMLARAQEADDPVAQALLRRLDDAMYPEYYELEMQMVTRRPGQDDLDYHFNVLGAGTDKSLMTMTEPARERGKQVLLNGDNLWLFVPDVSRPVKLTRKSSFMGSTFSNEDVMNTTMADDYTARILRRMEINDRPYYEIALQAKRRDVAYARITAVVDSLAAIPDTMVYYGLSGKPIKKMALGDHKLLAGRLRPARMTMFDFLEADASTVVQITSLQARDAIPESTFDPTRLGK